VKKIKIFKWRKRSNLVLGVSKRRGGRAIFQVLYGNWKSCKVIPILLFPFIYFFFRFRVVDLIFKEIKPGEKSDNEKCFQIMVIFYTGGEKSPDPGGQKSWYCQKRFLLMTIFELMFRPQWRIMVLVALNGGQVSNQMKTNESVIYCFVVLLFITVLWSGNGHEKKYLAHRFLVGFASKRCAKNVAKKFLISC
jgi:hypothetical protein